MSFVEWYEDTYEDKWLEDNALLGGSAVQWIEEYQLYCEYRNIKPIWNG